MLKNRLLPGYVPPYPSELFSCWFLRVCKSHMIKSSSFSKIYLNNTPIWNRDIDCYPSPILYDFFLSHTSLSDKQFQLLFLSSYTDILWNGKMNSGRNNAILPIGVYHRIRKFFGLMCCPSCLKSEIKYYRKDWRLFTSIACSNCKCKLIDRCPHCAAPIEFHRLENGKKIDILEKALSMCNNCNKELSSCIDYLEEGSIILEYQNYIDNIIRKGFNKITGYSFTYIEVLIYLAKQLMTSSLKWNRIKICVENKLSQRFNKENQKIYNYDLNLRTEILPIAYMILKNYPDNFRKMFLGSNVRYSDFSKNMTVIPYWLIKEINDLN